MIFRTRDSQGAGTPSPRVCKLRSGRCYSLVLALAIPSLEFVAAQERPEEAASLIVAVGAGGEKDYDETFSQWAQSWREAGAKSGARVTAIGLPDATGASLPALRTALEQEPTEGFAPLWIVLLGHGTHDGREARFNLQGDDLTANELAEWLAPMRRPVVLIAAFSSSGAFLPPLSAPGRIIATATKSGSESNYARFGGYLSTTIADPLADLDHDGQTSLLEAWLLAARRTADFYAEDGRLATEHPLLDDNGDGRGTPADWFQGIRAVKKSGSDAVPDGPRAHQMHLVSSAAEREMSPVLRTERDAIESDIERLRQAKSELKEDEYYSRLEAMMLRLARIYRDARGESPR